MVKYILPVALLVLQMIPPLGLDASMYENQMRNVITLHESGQLALADEEVREFLTRHGDNLTVEERRSLEYEIERSARIRRDYSLTRERLYTFLDGNINDLTRQEFEDWIEEGLFDRKVIDGEERFVGPSRSNLFFRNQEIRARRTSEVSDRGPQFLLEHARRVRQEITHPSQTHGQPRKFVVRMNIRALPGAAPAGETIRCWMPFPQQTDFQSGVELLSANPSPLHINGPQYPPRAIYFDQPSMGEEETVFEAAWAMESRPRLYRIDPELVAATDQTSNPYHGYFTAEKAPHVLFSDRIRDLAEEITGGEPNPAVRARLIYDWISNNKQYSYAREYSTLRNIPEYVLDQGYGDCGQIALLFITLCRAAGVPARWQSGWVLYPFNRNLHDWSEIYLAPYGWVPVDADFAMSIRSHYDTLSEAEKDELVDFYFGGMDGYRMAVNSDHGYPHFPPKEDFRSDNVDFQRGELEANGRNIYFSHFRYRLAVDYLEPRDPDPISNPETPGLTAPGVAR
ncbi:MAG: transglutaminase domain-containing protein [Candidatus Sumerlaeia bacterium]|nr:transglutaminase domain-containing protein [Candidatus Sumerlaeia bacterium]